MQLVRYADSYREASEDRADFVTVKQGVVLVVADGVGGQPGGGPAADLAARLVREAAEAMPDIEDPTAWYNVVLAIEEELEDDEEAGQTTLVVVAVTTRRVMGVSVGDSEAWLVRPDGHFDLTGAQKRKPYLGSGAEPTPFSLKRPANGTILVATDGLFKYAPAERILDAAAHPELEGSADRLSDLARLPNGRLPDDLALVLCRFDDATPRPLARLTQWFARPRKAVATKRGTNEP